MKRLSFLSLISVLLFSCSLLFHQIILCHGFSGNTQVKMVDGRWYNFRYIYESNNNFTVISYFKTKAARGCIDNQIQNTASATSNCFISMRFDGTKIPDITCTPSQEFYVPAKKQWVPAFKLKKGDQLLSACYHTKAITHIEFVKKDLDVYMIEVGRPHNYCVGRYLILTHNVAIPAIYVKLAIAFGEGATVGGEAGSCFGPVTLAGGVVIGGLIGVGLYYAMNEKKPKPRYDFYAETLNDHFQRNNGNANYNSGSSYQNAGSDGGQSDGQSSGNTGSFGGSAAGGGAPSPEDEDPRGPKKPRKGAGLQSKKGDPDQYKTDDELRKSIKSFLDEAVEHKKKLEEFIKDPYGFNDGKKLKEFSDERIRQNIIKNYINHLNSEIRTFTNNAEKAQKILNNRG